LFKKKTDLDNLNNLNNVDIFSFKKVVCGRGFGSLSLVYRQINSKIAQFRF